METMQDTQEAGLAGEGSLATLFSGPARTRIIEAFVANKDRELNVSDVARLSDTARSTVYRHIENLEQLGIIKEIEVDGDRYTLDSDDELATKLRELEGIALKRLLEVEQESE
jgi:DNA-binding transcriptional ArsR family regulator